MSYTLIVASFIVLLIAILLGLVRYFDVIEGAPPARLSLWERKIGCAFSGICKWRWAYWCSMCVDRYLGDADEVL